MQMEITYVFIIIIICIIINNIYAILNNNNIDNKNRDNNNDINNDNNNDSINRTTTIVPTTTITTMMMVHHNDNNHNHGNHININNANNNNMNTNYTHYVKVFHYIINHWGDSKKGIQICLTHNIVCDWYHSDNIKILRDNLVYHTQPYYPHHHPHHYHQHHNHTYHHHNHRRITTQQLQHDHNITINNSLIINESLIHYPYYHHSNQQQHHDNNHYHHHHQLPMITLSLYNIHSWWEHTRNVLPASCDLHTNLTIFETEESKIRYQQLFEQSYQHYDGYSSTSPYSNIQRVYNEAYLKNSTFLKLNKYDMMIKGASYVASDCHKHDSVNCKL